MLRIVAAWLHGTISVPQWQQVVIMSCLLALSIWLTLSLLFGAFAASLAAVEGGQLRDGTWNERVLTPRRI